MLKVLFGLLVLFTAGIAQADQCSNYYQDFEYTSYCRNYGGRKHDQLDNCTYTFQCPRGCYAEVDHFWESVQDSRGELTNCDLYNRGDSATVRCDYRSRSGTSTNYVHFYCTR